jgi:pyruvate dehydrogenase E1 component beta subunit
MANECLKAAALLEEKGIDAEVIDLMSLRPLDTKLIIDSVSKTSRAMIVHEAPAFGGFGAEIASCIAASDAFFYLDAPIARIGGMEMPIAYTPSLEAAQVPSAKMVYEAALEMMG